jgi:hypothetical protein
MSLQRCNLIKALSVSDYICATQAYAESTRYLARAQESKSGTWTPVQYPMWGIVLQQDIGAISGLLGCWVHESQ